MSGAPGTGPGRRRRGRAGNGTLLLALAAVGTGGWLITVGARTTAPHRPLAAHGLGGPAARSAVRETAPPPLRLRVPAAGTDGAPAGPGHDGPLPAPPAGRFRDGVPPGCPGATAVTGRVGAGPAAWHAAAALPPRAAVGVRRADGHAALLTAGAVASDGDGGAPGAATRPVAHLLTCGDAGRGSVSVPPAGTG